MLCAQLGIRPDCVGMLVAITVAFDYAWLNCMAASAEALLEIER